MKKSYLIFYNLLVFIIILSCNSQTKNTAFNNDRKVKNIILMIGDGMGLSHIYAAYTYKNGKLNIERCNYMGIQKTYSNNKYITDSGASGTAIATGIKTNNGMISVTPDSVKAETILEFAEKNGLSTGMAVTCAITHATPAVFVAHQVNRKMHEEIAYDLYKSGIDLFIGGGRKYFEKRSDKMNLLDSLKNNGYNILTNIDDIKKTNSGKIAGLIENNDPPVASKRDNMLSTATEVAIKILEQSKNGFFLMVEGSQIDWASHDNDAEYLLAEVIDFDNAVGKALDFAEKDGNTLVIITADHETGGLAIFGGDVESGKVDIRFSSNEHTGVWVPVFTFGPYAENFTGFYENTQIFDKMMDAFGFENE